MSTEETVSKNTLIFLHPEQIIWPDETNVRPGWDAAVEEADIKNLAESIKKDGQVQPIRVRPNDNGDETFLGVAGRRRATAIALLNAELTAKEEPLMVMAICGEDDGEESAYRMALMENLKRKDFNPLDMAKNIRIIRDRKNWEGAKGTKKVADYLGVSPAYVTTHEGLLNLDKATQERIQKGEIKRDYAFELLNVVPDKQRVVEETAQQLAEADEEAVAAKTGRKKKAAKATAKHVRTASRTHAAAISLKPLSRGEVLDWFVKVQANPKYGYPNGSIQFFAKSLLMWAEGKIKDETLAKHFDTMVAKADRGKAEKGAAKDEAKEELKKKKTAKPSPKK